MNFKKILNLILSLQLIILVGCVKQSEITKDEKESPEKTQFEPFEKQLLREDKSFEELTKKETGKNLQEIEQEILKKEDSVSAERKVPETQKTTPQAEQKEKLPEESMATDQISPAKEKTGEELDFYVHNITGKTIYVACFSYIQKESINRWRWDKSDVYKISNNQSILVDVDTIPDKQNRKNIYGYLAVFDNPKDAETAAYELIDDKNKIDLDLLHKLKDQEVIIGIEKYGYKGELLDYVFTPLKKSNIKHPELDFLVENKTGKSLWLTCFVYEIKEDMPVWKFEKTPVLNLEPNETGIIDVSTITQKYDRVYVRGYLAAFDEKDEQKAKESTYELLETKNKINIGRLAALKNKKITLNVEKYGTVGKFIDYTVQPISRIDFQKKLKIK